MRRITMVEAMDTTGHIPFNFEEYDFLCRKLDHDFGGPIFNNEMTVKRNGQRSFKLILEYLANHGKGSCMEIAEYETRLWKALKLRQPINVIKVTQQQLEF